MSRSTQRNSVLNRLCFQEEGKKRKEATLVMGIPKFASWLSKKFPEMVIKHLPQNVCALYIDVNGVIHPCCHSDDDPTVAQRTDDEKIDNVCHALSDLVGQVRPQKLLYLAVDGVAPRAKMNQQRARRYMSAATSYGSTRFGLAPRETSFTEEEHRIAQKELKEARHSIDMGIYNGPTAADDQLMGSPVKSNNVLEAFGDIPSDIFTGAPPMPHAMKNIQEDHFDSNCISPGTLFMEKCAIKIKEYCQKMLKEDPAWSGLTVVVSDTNVPGEGEHKLIDFMRVQSSHREWSQMAGAHVIAGLDADLILLCLSLHINDVFVLRDNRRESTFAATGRDVSGVAEEPAQPPGTTSSRKIEYYDISAAGNGIVSEVTALAKHLGVYTSNDATHYVPTCQIINDFITLASMMGNDFLPRIPSAFCGDSAMDNFMEVYVRHVLGLGGIASLDGRVALKPLKVFLREYSKIEVMMFRQHLIKTEQIRDVMGAGCVGSSVDKKWRDAYFDTTTVKRKCLGDACVKYIEGLQFVWQYYSQTSADCAWEWFYPFSHAPCAMDLADTLDKQDVPLPPRQTTAPSPFVQLLAILPPTSALLVPRPLRRVMLDPPPALRSSFPLQWAVDYAGANGKEHLATVILPFTDLAAVKTEVSKCLPEIPAEESRRNRTDLFDEVFALPSTPQCILPEGSEFSERDGVRVAHYVNSAPLPKRPRTYATTALVRGVACPQRQQRGAPRPAPSIRGLSLGDFVLCCGAISILAVAFLSSSAELFGSLARVIVYFGGAFVLLMAAGCASADTATGSQINRNAIRDAYVDWICARCLSLNFHRNEACFFCQLPFDEKESFAVFSSKIPQTPPALDPCHTAYVQEIELHVPADFAHAACEAPAASASQ